MKSFTKSLHSFVCRSLADWTQHFAFFSFSLHHMSLIELFWRKENSKGSFEFITNELFFRNSLLRLSSSWKSYLSLSSGLVNFFHVHDFFSHFIHDLHLIDASWQSVTRTKNLCPLKVFLKFAKFIVKRRSDKLKLIFFHDCKFLHIFVFFYFLLNVSHFVHHLKNIVFSRFFIIFFLNSNEKYLGSNVVKIIIPLFFHFL